MLKNILHLEDFAQIHEMVRLGSQGAVGVCHMIIGLAAFLHSLLYCALYLIISQIEHKSKILSEANSQSGFSVGEDN